MSSSSNPRTHETGTFALALGIGFVVPDVLSSRSFGDRPEGGVPNSSPSEPRSESREGRGFDLAGAVRARRRSGGRRSAVRAVLQKMLYAFAEETKFLELVR